MPPDDAAVAKDDNRPGSTESAALVVAVVEAVNRDPVRVLAFAHPEVELCFRLDPSPGAAARCFCGHVGIVAALRPAFAAFTGLHSEVVELAQLESGSVVARIHHRARGAASRALCRTDLFHAAQLREGLVIRWEVFLEEPAALSAGRAKHSDRGKAAGAV